jgi:hypothetical protein
MPPHDAAQTPCPKGLRASGCEPQAERFIVIQSVVVNHRWFDFSSIF